jgi:cellulose synthase/poly-beta-1,6-N-acetylglucosamine synthase-like glycosyltransferase
MAWLVLLLLLLSFGYAILINQYHRNWNSLAEFKAPTDSPVSTISVIIPVRNESAHIRKLLSSLEAQEFPKERWEVILVDDFSDDDTLELATPYVRSDRFSLRIICLKDLFPDPERITAHKKKALTAGIELAKGTLIVTSDGDCIFPERWLHTLVHFHEKTGAKMIAAPVRMGPAETLIERFQSIDFLTLQGITGAVISSGKHSLCNGANLCYEKRAFQEVNGFEGIDHIASGDDILLMQKFRKRFPGNIHFLKSRDAIVTTAPVNTWKEFFLQRIRWASKTGQYKESSLYISLAQVYSLNVSFLVLTIFSINDMRAGTFLLLFFLGKLLIEFPFVNTIASFFSEKKQMKWFVVLQPLHIAYTVLAGTLGVFGNYQWKGRKINSKFSSEK